MSAFFSNLNEIIKQADWIRYHSSRSYHGNVPRCKFKTFFSLMGPTLCSSFRSRLHFSPYPHQTGAYFFMKWIRYWEINPGQDSTDAKDSAANNVVNKSRADDEQNGSDSNRDSTTRLTDMGRS